MRFHTKSGYARQLYAASTRVLCDIVVQQSERVTNILLVVTRYHTVLRLHES